MLLSRNRLFERRPASREAKIIYIFCEGADRELKYFQYFREMDSRINLEIYELHPHEDNSPNGLLEIAKRCILQTEEHSKPKYNFQDQDEVWIVLDSDPDKLDSRSPQILAVKADIGQNDRWFLVESNPCFEVWLFFHGKENFDEFEGIESPGSWKNFLNEVFKGGFDIRKHPIFIEDAKLRAESKFKNGEDGRPKVGSTEVYLLAESILHLLGDKIREARKKLT